MGKKCPARFKLLTLLFTVDVLTPLAKWEPCIDDMKSDIQTFSEIYPQKPFIHCHQVCCALQDGTQEAKVEGSVSKVHANGPRGFLKFWRKAFSSFSMIISVTNFIFTWACSPECMHNIL